MERVGVEPMTSARALVDLYYILRKRQWKENLTSNPTRSILFSLQAPYLSIPSSEVLRKSAMVVK
jgi:hypothetical protein